MKRFLFLLGGVLSLVLSLSAAAATSADRPWTVTDLGVDAQWSRGYAINNHGAVAGQSSRGGFLWRDGSTTFLGGNVWPQDVNDRRQVVGQHYVASRGAYVAFLWEDGILTDLGAPNGTSLSASHASAINDRGQIVGTFWTTSGEQHSFLWQDGVMTELGTLGGRFSSAVDINDRGQIVGYSETIDQLIHAVLWEDGKMTDLGAFGTYGFSWATAISSDGQVAGLSHVPYGSGVHPVLWDDGSSTDLAPGMDPSVWWEIYGVNKRGQVVGVRRAPGASQATIWQNGSMSDLPTLGGIYSEALDINDRGQATGSSHPTNQRYESAVVFSQK